MNSVLHQQNIKSKNVCQFSSVPRTVTYGLFKKDKSLSISTLNEIYKSYRCMYIVLVIFCHVWYKNILIVIFKNGNFPRTAVSSFVFSNGSM